MAGTRIYLDLMGTWYGPFVKGDTMPLTDKPCAAIDEPTRWVGTMSLDVHKGVHAHRDNPLPPWPLLGGYDLKVYSTETELCVSKWSEPIPESAFGNVNIGFYAFMAFVKRADLNFVGTAFEHRVRFNIRKMREDEVPAVEESLRWGPDHKEFIPFKEPIGYKGVVGNIRTFKEEFENHALSVRSVTDDVHHQQHLLLVW